MKPAKTGSGARFFIKRTSTTISRQLRRLSKIGDGYPRLGFAIAWGYHSFRQLRWLVA
jgi:hypothetical protein